MMISLFLTQYGVGDGMVNFFVGMLATIGAGLSAYLYLESKSKRCFAAFILFLTVWAAEVLWMVA